MHGGRMSLRDSVFVALQTIGSSGAGASVGLEAGYTQAASGLASHIGRRLRLRRADMRLMVGCAAGGAIGAAFDAPLTGAFYAFELILGSYSIAAFVPVMAATFMATVTRQPAGALAACRRGAADRA
ncbi:Chloride channel protein, CIC family OS=Bosea thiooxidans OX=53254 GN=SAMN05660750_04652 PE=4 SV=1 [Bosea thiooxidans]